MGFFQYSGPTFYLSITGCNHLHCSLHLLRCGLMPLLFQVFSFQLVLPPQNIRQPLRTFLIVVILNFSLSLNFQFFTNTKVIPEVRCSCFYNNIFEDNTSVNSHIFTSIQGWMFGIHIKLPLRELIPKWEFMVQAQDPFLSPGFC